MEDYFIWYADNHLSKRLTRNQFLEISKELWEKQSGKCAISGTELSFDHEKNRPLCPYLKYNHPLKKPWLPEYELVSWVFRPVKFQTGDGKVQYTRGRGVYVQSDDDEDSNY